MAVSKAIQSGETESIGNPKDILSGGVASFCLSSCLSHCTHGTHRAKKKKKKKTLKHLIYCFQISKCSVQEYERNPLVKLTNRNNTECLHLPVSAWPFVLLSELVLVTPGSYSV